MGMTWFMIPASLVICTVLLTQTERSGKGMLKMLSLPVRPALCLAKFTVLVILAFGQMGMTIGRLFPQRPRWRRRPRAIPDSGSFVCGFALLYAEPFPWPQCSG